MGRRLGLVAATVLLALLEHCGGDVEVVGGDVGVGSDVGLVWSGETVRDLHKEYRNIFRKGNRNAASHLWSSFLLDRAAAMPAATLELMFSGFCAISGSPVRPGEYTRYSMQLHSVTTGRSIHGYAYFCCWPCVCDTEDFVQVDTRTVTTADGPRRYHFLVIGNPCLHPDKVPDEAPEVTCDSDGQLEGATLSDHGHVILTRFPLLTEAEADAALPAQRQIDFVEECKSRKEMGYNSGMGDIFRAVAGISPLQPRRSGEICSGEICAAESGPSP